MKTIGKKTNQPVFDSDGYQVGVTDLNGEPLPEVNVLKTKPFRGGARVGAGRKKLNKSPVLLRLSPGTAQRLRDAAKRSGKTLSQIAEERLASL